MKNGTKSPYLLLENDQYKLLSVINLSTTKIWMFILVYGLAYMIWQIRHIKDDTLVKKECIVGLGFGLFINFVMTGIYLMGQYDQWCSQSLP